MLSSLLHNRSKTFGWFLALIGCIVSSQLQAQSFSFPAHEKSERHSARQIQVHSLPDTIIVRGDVWQDILSNPSWRTDFKVKSVQNFVKLSIDHAYPRKIKFPYTYSICYQVYAYRDSTTFTAFSPDTLSISYKPDSLATYQDIVLKRFSNYHKLMIIISAIIDQQITPVVMDVDTMTALNFSVEGNILTQRYDKRYAGNTYYGEAGVLNSSASPDPSSDIIEIKWNLSGLSLSNPVPIEPVNFELEWTYMDNYKKDITSGAITGISASSIAYDFSHNATRVWLDTNYFRLPSIYQKGFLAYRVRIVRPDSANYRYPIYSNWTAPDQGTLSGLTPVSQYIALNNAHKNDSVNWQYTVSFAENGRYKHVMSYFDGLLKNRQSITRFNSNPEQLIATEQIYDYEGRPSISILPTPVPSSSFSYRENLSLNALTGLPYEAADFDTLQKETCPVVPPPTPLHPNALASIYYSPLNPDKSGFQKFVPDAGGYPFVQTLYSPGYDKRIDRQGGAGDTLQIGFGHDTHNDYVSADQTDLNSLFGIDAGWSGYYRKTVTSDPNGQISMSIQDYKGRQVASSMIGRGPDPNRHAIIPNDNVPDSSFKIDELITGMPQSVSGNKKTLNRDFYMDVTGYDSVQYVFDFTPMPVCPPGDSAYLSVKAHYNYQIFDQCGNLELEVDSTLGITGRMKTGAIISGTEPMRGVFLPKGKHTLTKELTVNVEDIHAAVDSLMLEPPGCFKDEYYFIKNAVLKRQFPCPPEDSPCDLLKKQMMDELWPGKKYGQYSINAPDSVAGTDNSIFTRYCDTTHRYDTVSFEFAVIYTPHIDTIIDTICKYRYQLCPELPDTVIKFGRVYTNLAALPVATFIDIFNDEIAESLLPLHPEYCKLANCFDDNYQAVLESFPSAASAEANNRFLLDTIIRYDPMLPKLKSGPIYFSSAEDSLALFRGGNLGIDTAVLKMAYCHSTDSLMSAECYTRTFREPIATFSFIDPKVKETYYKFLLSAYFSNRERFRNYILAATDSNCGPCDSLRMSLIPDAVISTVFKADGSYESGSPFYSGLSDLAKRLLSYGSSMSKDSLLAYRDSSALRYDSTNLAINKARIDSIIARMVNCTPSANLSAMKDTLSALALRRPVLYGNFTPEMVRYALVVNGINLNDLCNPYLVTYDYMSSPERGDNIGCKAPLFYDDARTFLNKEPIEALVEATASGTSTMHLMSLSSGNEFEAEVISALSLSGPYNIKLFAGVNTDTSLYILHIMENTGSPSDTLRMYFEIHDQRSSGGTGCKNILAHSATPLSDVFIFSDIRCILEDYGTRIGSGFITSFSFLSAIEKTTGSGIETCELLSWNSDIKMTGNAASLQECVPCTQMLSLYREFSDSMTAFGVKGTDHPLHPDMLCNFMNDKLHRTFGWDQYVRFIESCALADSLPINRYNGYAAVSLASDVAAASFINYINTTDTVDLRTYLRYKADDSVHLLIDFNSLPFRKLRNVKEHIAAYAATVAVNKAFNPPAASDFMGWLLHFKGAAFDSTDIRTTVSAMFDVLPGRETPVWTGSGYTDFIRYEIRAKSGTNNTLIAAGIAALRDYIRSNGLATYLINARETTADDEYNTADKQDYLQYVYLFSQRKPIFVLDTIQASHLEANIYPSRSPQYGSSSGISDIRNLYLAQSAHPGLGKAQSILNAAVSYFGGTGTLIPVSFPASGQIDISTLPGLKLFYCGDQSYWYRYFGTGDTMFNIFFRMPLYIAEADRPDYLLTEVKAGAGDGPSRNLKLRFEKGSDVVIADGYTDFTVGSSQVLHDVLLTDAFGIAQPESDTILNCERSILNSAVRAGREDYRLYLDSIRLALQKEFYAWVMSHIGEKLYLGYRDQRFNYTLYYYDRAGNLNRTVPPAGVHKLPDGVSDEVNSKRSANLITPSVLPEHEKISVYEYNSLDKVIRQKTPDGGEVFYTYDELGRVIYSQNDKQAKMNRNAYTYTFYDKQGRVTETGQVDLNCGYWTYLYGPGGLHKIWMPCMFMWSEGTPGLYGYPPYFTTRDPHVRDALKYTQEEREAYIRKKSRTDVVVSTYDTVLRDLGSLEGINEQENLRKRVSCIRYFETLGPLDTFYRNYTYATHYSYDIAGNVRTLVHDYPSLAPYGQRYKTVDYLYDLASGKVNLLSYNKGWGDQFYQRYDYDDDNRITRVESSADGYIWKRDAAYEYYRHGPLARASIGDLRVQGIDFAYTIQGWLKAVNGDVLQASLDMGQDSMLHNVHAYDAAATTLDYFSGDYRPIGDVEIAHTNNPARNLYNGNISRKSSDLLPFDPLMANYTYDQLNRIKYANYDSMGPVVAGLAGLYPTPAYHTRYSYDPDGNISSLVRRANKPGAAIIMDSLRYYYASLGSPNRLMRLTDSAANNYIDDIDHFTDNSEDRYAYDPTGNVSKDLVSNQDTIYWNLYNKVIHTENHVAKDRMDFTYNGSGHRVAKRYQSLNDDQTLNKERNEYFVHDAQGNILAVYKHQKDYTYESIVPYITTLTTLSASIRSTLGTGTYIDHVLMADFARDAGFDAALAPYMSTFESMMPPKPMEFYLERDHSLTELLIYNSADWVDSLRNFSPQYGNPMLISGSFSTAYADKYHELGTHILRTLYSTPDLVQRKQLMALLETTLPGTGIHMLRSAHHSLGLTIDSMMDASQLAAKIADSVPDVALIAGALNTELMKAAHNTDLTPYFDYLFNPFSMALSSDSFHAHTIPALTQTVLAQYADRHFMRQFFGAWSQSRSRLEGILGNTGLYYTEYHSNPSGYLAAMAGMLGGEILDTAVAAIKGLTAEEYLERSYSVLSPSLVSAVDVTAATRHDILKTQIMHHERFDLAEHHLYGSSRLGIKNYLQGQVAGYYMKRFGSGMMATFDYDTGSLVKRQAWYNGQQNELIRKNEKADYGHFDSSELLLSHVLGLKQYEVTNHLGNVMSTVSDNRYEKDIDGPSGDTVKVFAPAVSTSYDYYPFGSLMPGRYLAADTVTERVDIYAVKNVKVYEGGPIPAPIGSTASPLGTAMISDLGGHILEMQADTIGSGSRSTMYVTPGTLTRLQLDALMHLGDPVRASVFESFRDSNQVMRERELAATIITMEGRFLLDFVPSGYEVKIDVLYNASGLSGTSAYSSGAGGAEPGIEGSGGKGFSKLVVSGTSITELEMTRWRMVKVVKNPNDLYRFGFNGQEKVNEIYGRGTHLDFGARYYDSRVGRWFGVDPLAGKYPWMTPYNAFENNPVYFKDKDGRDAEYTIKGNQIIVNSTIRLISSDEVAAKNLEKQIMKVWGGKHQFKDKNGNVYNIKFNVNVVVEKNILFMLSNDYKPSDNIAVIVNDNQYRDNVVSGKYFHFSKNSKAGPHEFGHSLGLADQYFDVYTRKDIGKGGNKDDYILSAQNYIGVDQYDIMGKAGYTGEGKVTDKSIESLGEYILNDAENKKENKNGERNGVISIRNPNLGEVSNETKVESGYEPPPISVSEDVVH